MSDVDAKDGFVIWGYLICIPFGISVLVSFANDYAASNIQRAKKPVKACKRFFKALKTGRAKKAYSALVPTAKTIGQVDPLSFKQIPYDESRLTIKDMKSFVKYWKAISKGNGGHNRTYTLKKAKLLMEKDDMAVVKLTYDFSSYHAMLLLTLFFGLLLGAIIVSVCTKRETKEVYKLLVKRDGKWFMAEAEFKGALDSPGVLDL